MRPDVFEAGKLRLIFNTKLLARQSNRRWRKVKSFRAKQKTNRQFVCIINPHSRCLSTQLKPTRQQLSAWVCSDVTHPDEIITLNRWLSRSVCYGFTAMRSDWTGSVLQTEKQNKILLGKVCDACRRTYWTQRNTFRFNHSKLVGYFWASHRFCFVSKLRWDFFSFFVFFHFFSCILIRFG